MDNINKGNIHECAKFEPEPRITREGEIMRRLALIVGLFGLCSSLAWAQGLELATDLGYRPEKLQRFFHRHFEHVGDGRTPVLNF